MKRLRILYGIGACLMALILWFSFSRQQTIRHHTSGWHSAYRHHMNGTPIPRLQQIFNYAKGPGMYWVNVSREHEAALIKLGYLTNCEFRLTNQVITREFSSNFFHLIYQRLGTNTDQVWECPY